MTGIKEAMDKSIIMVEDFNIPLSVTDRTNKQRMSKCIEDLKNTVNHLRIIDT